jgi:uncharacterized protein YxeA
MKKISIFLTILLMLFVAMSMVATDDNWLDATYDGQTTSFATNFRASSGGDDYFYDCGIDSIYTTQWASQTFSGSNNVMSYTVDLGSIRSINNVEIKWRDGYYPLSFDIEISDDNSDDSYSKYGNTTYNTSGQDNSVVNTFDLRPSSVSTRFMKIKMLDNNGIMYAIREVTIDRLD